MMTIPVPSGIKPTCAGSEPSGSARGVSGIGSRPPSLQTKASERRAVSVQDIDQTTLLCDAPRRAAARNGVQQCEGVLTSRKDAQVAAAGVGDEQVATIAGEDDGPL